MTFVFTAWGLRQALCPLRSLTAVRPTTLVATSRLQPVARSVRCMAAPATLEYGQQDSQYTGQPSGGNGASRVFSDFSIYKGKSACTLKVRKAQQTILQPYWLGCERIKHCLAVFACQAGLACQLYVSPQVISPTFSPTQRGDYQLSKQGALLLEFANAQEGTGNAPGQRRYDWNNKQVPAAAVRLY